MFRRSNERAKYGFAFDAAGAIEDLKTEATMHHIAIVSDANAGTFTFEVRKKKTLDWEPLLLEGVALSLDMSTDIRSVTIEGASIKGVRATPADLDGAAEWSEEWGMDISSSTSQAQ
jgi:hypothetical protein